MSVVVFMRPDNNSCTRRKHEAREMIFVEFLRESYGEERVLQLLARSQDMRTVSQRSSRRRQKGRLTIYSKTAGQAEGEREIDVPTPEHR